MSRAAVRERAAAKAPAKTPVKKAAASKPTTGRAASKKSTAKTAPAKRTRAAKELEPDEQTPPPKFVIERDERTAHLTAQALACRETNHFWKSVAQGHVMRALLAHRGQFETVRVCQTCQSTKSDLYWLPTFEKARATRYTWSEGYLIDKQFAGSGRLSKADILKEQFVRENLDLVA